MKARKPAAALVALCVLAGCFFLLTRQRETFLTQLRQYSDQAGTRDSSKIDGKNGQQKDVLNPEKQQVGVAVVAQPARAALGVPPADSQNDVIILPSKDEMSNQPQDKMATMYHNYINSLQISCKKITRMGKLDDGGWDICDDIAYRPGTNCLVYSFGINFDFSFDDAIVKKYGCEVHSFDPSMRRPDHKHAQKVFFHAAGLSKDNKPSRGKNWKMRTLKQFMTELGHINKTIDVLKIDIEEWEWLALPEMLKSGVMKQVRQFDVELHITLKHEPNKQKYFLGLSILKDLYDAGFRIFWTHRNLYCKFSSRVGSVARSGCHEVSFINVNYRKPEVTSH